MIEKLERKKTYVRDEKGDVIGVSGDDLPTKQEMFNKINEIIEKLNERE